MGDETRWGAERTFAVHGLFALPDLADGTGVERVEPLPGLSLRETFHDAADLRLVRAGVLLCHCTGEGDPRWTLHLPDGDERSAPGAAADETVPGPLRDLVTAHLRRAPLEPVAVLRTDRLARRLVGADGSDVGELVDDTVSVLDGRRVVARFRELVLRHDPDDDGGDALAAVAHRLTDAGAVPSDSPPRVLRALGPRAAEPSDLLESSAVGPADPAALLVAAAVRRGLRGIVAADLDVRRGRDDGVHQVRVSCRRLRSDVATLAPLVLPDAAAHLRTELAWLADALGAARDLEVLRARLRRTAAADPLAPLDAGAVDRIDALLAAEEEQAQGRAAEALASERYVDLLEALVHWAGTPPATQAADAPCAEVLPPLLAAAWSRLDRAARRLRADSKDEPWHRARIRAKRARYAAEAVTPALGKRAKRLARAAEGLQEVLGEHQDAAIAAERVLALAARLPGDAALVLTAGRLAERERAAVRRARAQFPPAWREASRDRTSGWLRGPRRPGLRTAPGVRPGEQGDGRRAAAHG